MKKSRRISAVGVIAAGAMVIVGCSAGGGTAGAPQTTPTSVESSKLVYGQTLGISQLNPNITSTENEVPIMYLMYSGLTQINEDQSVEGDIAKDWTESGDGLEWTFTLRDDVVFHDGTPLIAKHVVDTVEYVTDEGTPSQWAAKISAVESVVQTDETTVVFTLIRPDPQLAQGLSYIRIINADELDTINVAPNGTGPFEFESFTPGQELVVIANKNYHGAKPEVDEIRIVTYPDQTAAERALISGELTALYGVPKNNINALLENDSLQVIDSPDPGGLAAWAWDTTSAPFDDVRARQALSYATDRETMMAVGYGGFASANPANTTVSPSSPLYNNDLVDYEFDLQKAATLFAEAGITEGSTITFWTLAGSFPEWVSMAEVLQEDLAEIGITLQIESNEVNTWLEAFYPNGKSFPGFIVANQLSFPPAPDSFSATWFGENGTCECNWKGNDEYNAAVDIATSSSDADERFAAFQVIQAEISKNLPMLIIGNVGATMVAQTSLSGVWMYGDNHVHLERAKIG